MEWWEIVLALLIICFFVLKKVSPYLLSIVCSRILKAQVLLGRIDFIPLAFQDVHLETGKVALHIGTIRLASSLVSTDCKRLLGIVLKDVKIKLHDSERGSKEMPVTSSDPKPFDPVLFEERMKHLFTRLTSLVQSMCVSIYRVTFVSHIGPHESIYATLKDITVNGSILYNTHISIISEIHAFSCQILSSDPAQLDNARECVGEASFTAWLETCFGTTDSGKNGIESIRLKVKDPQFSVSDNLTKLLRPKNHGSKASRKIPEELLKYFIPQAIDVNMTNVTFKASAHGSELSSFMGQLECAAKMAEMKPLWRETHVLPNFKSELKLDKWTIDTSMHGNALSLDSLLLSVEGGKAGLVTDTTWNRLSINYYHSDVAVWLRSLRSDALTPSVETKRPAFAFPNVKWEAKLWDFSGVIHLEDREYEGDALRAGLNHAKLSGEKKGSEVQIDLVTEILWFALADTIPSSPSQEKHHVFGTVLHTSWALFNLNVFIEDGVVCHKRQVMLDGIRLEWSPKLASKVLALTKCFGDFRRSERPKHISTADAKKIIQAFSVTCANCNAFFLTEKEVGFMVRVDSLVADKDPSKLAFTFEGCKLKFLVPGNSYPCLMSSDIKGENAGCHRLSVNYKSATGFLQVEVNESFSLDWSTSFHMCGLQLFREWKQFRSRLSDLVPVQKTSIPETPLVSRQLLYKVKVKVILGVKLSSNHQMRIMTGDLVVKKKVDGMDVSCNEGRIYFDQHKIFEANDISVTLTETNPDLSTERASTEFIVSPENRACVISISGLRIIFPYCYPFADVCMGQFIGITKWLKLVHERKRKNFRDREPLPRDLRIMIKECSLEVGDDPFEVRLRDNYELLEDEYKESLKRKRMLEAKIDELRKTHPLLPQGKIDELYAGLAKKNAEIYVQRSRRMYELHPARTALFVWSMTDVDIIALADSQLMGYDSIVRHIQDIDQESPWPDEGIEFTTLWMRGIRASCKLWRFQLRDFPQPLLHMTEFMVWGRLVGAEQEASWRAKRTVTVEVDEPWTDCQVERSMTALKFYHDFSADVENLSFAYGICWEPVLAQCNLCMDLVFPPSKDPSPPLPFWDKLRLVYHGRLTMSAQQLTLLLHTSLDPYNTTEEMELTWRDLIMDWTTAKFLLKGDLSVYVRTASKYDDCQLLHLPNLKLTIGIEWLCLGHPYDHHNVMPCAPDRLPEYSSNQVHDSYRAFRTQNMDMTLSMETKSHAEKPAIPSVLLYGSTLRWFENLKFILSGVSRPIRRGKLFDNLKPRKIQLSRHYKNVRLSVSFHCFQIRYWMSFSMQRGFEVPAGRLTLSSEHSLMCVPVDDGLKHRPRANWSVNFLNCELNDAEVWLRSALIEDAEELNISLRQPVEKCYFLSVMRVSYVRDASLPRAGVPLRPGQDPDPSLPTHRLVVHDLRGAWTKKNRDVVIALYDSWVKAQLLKKNLSMETMKIVRVDNTSSPGKLRGGNSANRTTGLDNASPPSGSSSTTNVAAPSPNTRLQTGHAASLLQKLIADAEARGVVFSEDLEEPNTTRGVGLQGVGACQTDDVLHTNWLVELVNSQVLLKGCETQGYVIMSAAHAQILQRIHRPVWRETRLLTKASWISSFDGMQYFATVNAAGDNGPSIDENIMWISIENIGVKDQVIAEPPDMVGSGQSVGGVVSETVGGTDDPNNTPIQLQRIVSRCKCEVFYVSYGDSPLDPGNLGTLNGDEIIPPPAPDGMGYDRSEQAADSFTLMHHDLNICTNSLQYAMVLDVINNLILYVEPHRKEASEKLQRMRFQLQLSSVEDQRRPVQQLQNQLRSLVSQLRRLEKETYTVQRALQDGDTSDRLLREMELLERKVYECKEQLNCHSEELAMLLACIQEIQLAHHQKLNTRNRNGQVCVLRTSEICFKHAQWRLTETDGQLGIADLTLTNFLYTKQSKSDDSVEHLLEVGYVSVTNLLPNQPYKQVLVPTELNPSMPVQRQFTLRIFSRDKAPVGGICIKEHFEINVVPVTFAITYQFFKTMMKFCFPEKDPETMDEENEGKKKSGSQNSTLTKKGKESNFYVSIEEKDDVEKMKERAEKNKLFIYIKVPEVPVRVSYKGGKEKNIEDVHEISLVIPTMEFHNVTWTWLDLFLAMKSDSKRVLLSQAIKQKLQIRPRTIADHSGAPHEEDKARLLLGSNSIPGEGKSARKGFFKK